MLSFLDQDLYKFTTLQLIWKHFPVQVKYKLFDRKNLVLPIWDRLKPQIINKYAQYLRVSPTYEDVNYLRHLGYDYNFLDYLRVNFDYNNAHIDFTDGITISGSWLDCCLWEIPLLQIVNEVYCDPLDSRLLIDRIDSLGVDFTEFGTRRRQSKLAQEIAIQRLHYRGLKSTSNVEFARKYQLEPVGTFPHELILGLSTLHGEENAPYEAIKLVKKEFPNQNVVALPDTYTTDKFLLRFDEVEELCNGIRHDSGCPFVFTDKIVRWYKEHNKNLKDKYILYTDSIDLVKKIQIIEYTKKYFQAKFGIGTYCTNISKNRPDTIIKPVEINHKKVYKISDDPKKSTIN